jgi:hypothetical protein
MTADERERALKLLAIARDTTKPLAARKSAANEVARIKAKLASKPRTPAPQQELPPWWIASHTVLLQGAAVREDQPRIDALVAEFVANGVPVPDYPGKPWDPAPEVPERPAAPLIDINERQMAIGARRTYPAGKSVVGWDQFRDQF